MVLIVGLVSQTGFGQRLHQRGGIGEVAKGFILAQGQLERGASQVAGHDAQIVRIAERVFGRAAKEVAWVLANILIQGTGPGNEDSRRLLGSPPGPPGLLPGA